MSNVQCGCHNETQKTRDKPLMHSGFWLWRYHGFRARTNTQTRLIIPNTGPNVPWASREVKRKQIKTDSSYLFIERVSE